MGGLAGAHVEHGDEIVGSPVRLRPRRAQGEAGRSRIHRHNGRAMGCVEPGRVRGSRNPRRLVADRRGLGRVSTIIATGERRAVKTSLDELAVFGGAPEFAEPVHVGRPNIGDREVLRRRIDDMLDRNWLTNDGPYVRELERRTADQLGVRHCLAMASGTVALEIAIRAAGLTGEVIVPSFTFVATAHALQWQQITPVFCDIDPATHTIDPRKVEALITPKTTAIL